MTDLALDPAVRARLGASLLHGKTLAREVRADDLRAALAALAAQAARLAAAESVLAAADQWASGANPEVEKGSLFRAVVAWRAARKEAPDA